MFGEVRNSGSSFARGNLDLDFHARIGEPGADHGRGRANFAEVLPQDGPARREVLDARKDVADANYFAERAAGFTQSPLDIAKALLGLLDDIARDRHGLVVETGSAGYEDPLAVHQGTRVADITLQRRTG